MCRFELLQWRMVASQRWWKLAGFRCSSCCGGGSKCRDGSLSRWWCRIGGGYLCWGARRGGSAGAWAKMDVLVLARVSNVAKVSATLLTRGVGMNSWWWLQARWNHGRREDDVAFHFGRWWRGSVWLASLVSGGLWHMSSCGWID